MSGNKYSLSINEEKVLTHYRQSDQNLTPIYCNSGFCPIKAKNEFSVVEMKNILSLMPSHKKGGGGKFLKTIGNKFFS